MDSIIGLISVLFILSMINERIVNFIKLQCSNKKFLWINFGNLKDASTNDDEEDARTKRIILLNMLFGTLVAVAMRADLITIMSNIGDPSKGMGWDKTLSTWNYVLLPVGCFLTGCFLSLGSKFWHDLLDVMLQVKELKRILVSQANSNGNGSDSSQLNGSIMGRNSHYQPTGLASAKMAITSNSSSLLRQFPNITKMIAAFDIEDQNRVPCVDICLKDSDSKSVPPFLTYQKPDGTTGTIKVRVIPNFSGVNPQAGRGDQVFNANTPAFVGTVACILGGSDPSTMYALTCNHVLTGKNFADPGNLGQEAQENLQGDVTDLGPWIAGKMSNTVDAAVIQITDTSTINPNNLNATDPYFVGESDCSLTTVELQGGMSDLKSGIIIHVNQSMPVNYLNQQVTVDGLITVSATNNPNDFSPVTVEGDSGSLVYHASLRKPIGMVLGANDQFTYIMPINSVIKAFPSLGLSIL